MAEKKTIPAREALADIRVGMTDDQLMAKYNLTEKGLRSLKIKLLAAGLLLQDQTGKSQSVEVPHESDTKVLARKIAEAVRAEWSDEEIAKTFGLLPDKLPNVFPLLIKHGYLTQEDHDRRQSRLEEVIDIELDFEPMLTDANVRDEPAPSAAALSGTQIPLRGDSKTMARRIADAVKAGYSDEEIATTFALPAGRLTNVFAALIEYGYLTQEDCDRPRSRSEQIIDTELSTESAPAIANAAVDRTPFGIIRGRTLLASLLLAAIATFIAGGIMWGVWRIKPESPLANALSVALSEGFLLLCMVYLMYLAKLSPVALLGPRPEWPTLRKSMLFAFPLMGLSIAGTYLLYFPLSYLVPGFVKWSLLDHPLSTIICMNDYACIPSNLLNFVVIVLMAPVVEEFFFRGLLLTRWSVKWNVRRGIFASSLVFAILHPGNIIGAFFIGYVLSILYIQTKSLFVPIGVHIANNGLAWVFTGLNVLVGDPYARTTLAEWRSFWWAALVTGLIVSPWMIWFLRRHIPRPDWRVPYVALQDTP
jgi:membrane protease YdiL (CAAX protease family)/uncharacterized protein (DUF433 family)